MLSVAVLSGKGGTGKSSICASVGAVLAHCGFKTLIIDLDLFTHGVTFYLLGDHPGRIPFSLAEIFKRNLREIRKNAIPISRFHHAFTGGNLFILPSITAGAKKDPDLHLSREFSTIQSFRKRLEGIIAAVTRKYGFEYVLIDTRGGTDHTSVGAALAAGACLVVTEADKPSWDMGGVLIEAVDAFERKEDGAVRRMGFIINKNVLPSARIEAYLKRRWGLPHLGTIPLDEAAIRCFQEDRVPTAEKPGCDFSVAVRRIIRKGFVTNRWTDVSMTRLKRTGYPGLFRKFLDIF